MSPTSPHLFSLLPFLADSDLSGHRPLRVTRAQQRRIPGSPAILLARDWTRDLSVSQSVPGILREPAPWVENPEPRRSEGPQEASGEPKGQMRPESKSLARSGDSGAGRRSRAQSLCHKLKGLGI